MSFNPFVRWPGTTYRHKTKTWNYMQFAHMQQAATIHTYRYISINHKLIYYLPTYRLYVQYTIRTPHQLFSFDILISVRQMNQVQYTHTYTHIGIGISELTFAQFMHSSMLLYMLALLRELCTYECLSSYAVVGMQVRIRMQCIFRAIFEMP